jgi:UDP-glucose 4-epimerase
MRRMRTLVTGGAGFVGSHVVDLLLARGDEVHVIDNLATGSRENLAAGVELHELDIRDPAVETLGAELRLDVVFHLAAQADVGTSVERPVFDAEVNVVGTVHVLEAARAAGARLVFTSSGGAIYGECDEPATEDHARLPLSPYAVSKLAGEEYIAAWNRLHGTSHVVLRLANVYGPRQIPALEGGVVAIFLDRLARGETPVIFGDGTVVRDFVHVSDAAAAFLRAAEAGTGTYNVGTGVATSILDLYRACARTAGVDREPNFAAPRPGDLLRSVIDASRAERELGWRAETSLENGLAQTWAGLQSE